MLGCGCILCTFKHDEAKAAGARGVFSGRHTSKFAAYTHTNSRARTHTHTGHLSIVTKASSTRPCLLKACTRVSLVVLQDRFPTKLRGEGGVGGRLSK
jgi:hypothetical protein